MSETAGCPGCWYYSYRRGDMVCNKTGVLLDYFSVRQGCKDRTEEPPKPDCYGQMDPATFPCDRCPGLVVNKCFAKTYLGGLGE